MDSRKIRIVADSSADTLEIQGVAFASAPLKIITDVKEYTDDRALDVKQMVEELLSYKGKSTTSCPSAGDWMEAFGEDEEIFCVTITSGLSGSYNSACLAKQEYEEAHLDRRVFVIDSLSAGPELRLIIEKLKELITAGKAFDEIADEIKEYQKKTGLVFMLESMKNLANNGRCSPLVAKLAGALGIRLVGRASDQGELEPLDKCRGEKKALSALVHQMKSEGLLGGKIRIAHCYNEGAAQKLKDLILSEFAAAQIDIYALRGLCSFYAEKGGMLIGFEKGMA